MGADSVTYTITQETRRQIVTLTNDVIVARGDGTIGVLKKGTVLTIPWPQGSAKVQLKT